MFWIILYTVGGMFVGFKLGKMRARSKIQAAIDDGRVRSQYFPQTLIP